MNILKKTVFSISILLIPSLCFPMGAESPRSGLKVLKINISGKIEIARGYHEGLYLEGGDIWVVNGKDRPIWVLDLSSGARKGIINAAGTFTETVITHPDGGYWVSDWDGKRIYRARLAGNKLVSESSFSVEPLYPAGMIWTGRELFVIAWTGEAVGRYYLLIMDKGGNITRKAEIKGIDEPAHMAWDGKNIWMTSWNTPWIYRADGEKFKVTGVFTSPAKDATGIVWDGKYFWITGTHDDLYKVEVLE